jgi:hypothetical protein
MKCKELQHLLYSARPEELEPAEQESIQKHLAACEPCSAVFQNVTNADRLLARIKGTVPQIRNEQALTASIIKEIVNARKPAAVSSLTIFLDRLDALFTKEVIRFACGIVILMGGMSYVSMEYSDTKAIASLEQRLGKKSEANHAALFQQEINTMDFLRNLYGLSNGTISSVELTNTLVLMRKADLQALLKGYKSLDEASRTRLDAIWDSYRKEESSLLGSENTREEVNALRKEIERLKKELEQNNLRKGRP